MECPDFNKDNKGKVIEMSSFRKDDKEAQMMNKLDKLQSSIENIKSDMLSDMRIMQSDIKSLQNDTNDNQHEVKDIGNKINAINECISSLNTTKKHVTWFLAVIAIPVLIGGGATLYSISKQAANIDGRLGEIEKLVIGESTESDDDSLVAKVTAMESQISYKEKTIELPILLAGNNKQEPTNNAIEGAIRIKPNEISQTTSSLNADTYIGVDNTGKKYKASEIAGKLILLTYTEDDFEVYFLGQFNEKYHWNGYCVTNAYYKDGTFFGICESNFKDGIREDYESFYCSEDEKDVWIHTTRNYSESGNSGTTDKYSYPDNEMSVKKFNQHNVGQDDIMFVHTYLKNTEMTKLSHYKGLTSNGSYNDTSGDAYEIIYNTEDGTVKVLYMGRFKDGKFNDDKSAQQIVLDTSISPARYFYYIGTFTGGERDGTVSGKNYVTQEQINKIISDKKFDCMLKWYKTDS